MKKPLLNDVSPAGRVVLLVAAIAIAGLMLWFIRGWILAKGDLRLQVIGQNIEKLQESSAVMMVGTKIGQVRKKVVVNGKAVAHIVIDRQFANQLVDGCKFKVLNENYRRPENIFLRVEAPSDFSDRVRLAQDMTVETETSILPIEIPTGLISDIASRLVLFLLISLVFAIVRQLSRAIVWVILIAIALVAIWWVTQGNDLSSSRPAPPNEVSTIDWSDGIS